ncbi:hypothetical protein M8818_000761 [Zalaria obscura]|uniref:Uncharacterized protein n=1 Tax=Zalaria obscura TaxID=2024903 RepID=A0ACC3SMS6_9PEZI
MSNILLLHGLVLGLVFGLARAQSDPDSTADVVSFVDPAPFNPANQSSINDQITFGMPYTIRWQSSFSSSDLTLFQGPYADNSYSQVNLKSNIPQETTSFIWTPEAVNNQPLTYGFHLRIARSDDSQCAGCYANSVTFYIVPALGGATITGSAISSQTTSSAEGITAQSTADVTGTGLRSTSTMTVTASGGSQSPTSSTNASVNAAFRSLSDKGWSWLGLWMALMALTV